jgi:hypothetical protein
MELSTLRLVGILLVVLLDTPAELVRSRIRRAHGIGEQTGKFARAINAMTRAGVSKRSRGGNNEGRKVAGGR